MSNLLSALARDVSPRTYEQLTRVAGRTAIDNAVRRGNLTRLLPNQYCLTEHSESWLMRSHAAVAWAGPGAALSGQAALAARRYAPLPVNIIDVVVPSGRHRSGPRWLRVRSMTAPIQTSTLAPDTALVRPDLALALAYGWLPQEQRANFVHGAIRAGLTNAREVQDLLVMLPRVAARAELTQRLRLIAAGAESYLEERAMVDVLRGKAFAGLIFQHRMRVDGASYRVDAIHMPTRTAFELDSSAHHGDPNQRQRDVMRDAALATIGVQTVRYTYDDITLRPQWCRENALRVIAARCHVA